MDVMAELTQLVLSRVAVTSRATEVQRRRCAFELPYRSVLVAILRQRATGEGARQCGLHLEADFVGDRRCGERQLGGARGIAFVKCHGGGGAIRVGLRQWEVNDFGGSSSALGGSARLVQLAECQPAAGQELERG